MKVSAWMEFIKCKVLLKLSYKSTFVTISKENCPTFQAKTPRHTQICPLNKNISCLSNKMRSGPTLDPSLMWLAAVRLTDKHPLPYLIVSARVSYLFKGRLSTTFTTCRPTHYQNFPTVIRPPNYLSHSCETFDFFFQLLPGMFLIPIDRRQNLCESKPSPIYKVSFRTESII